jgi:hypothetical protein
MRSPLLQSNPRVCSLPFESDESPAVPIPEEPEDEASETEAELYLEECSDLRYDLENPDEEDE